MARRRDVRTGTLVVLSPTLPPSDLEVQSVSRLGRLTSVMFALLFGVVIRLRALKVD